MEPTLLSNGTETLIGHCSMWSVHLLGVAFPTSLLLFPSALNLFLLSQTPEAQ